MTDKPLVARCEPTVLTLEPGIYWWCACGRSKTQPFCDGTHDITDIKPVKLRLRATSEVALCNCKHSANKPYCDGTHERMTAEPVAPAEAAGIPVEPAAPAPVAGGAPEASGTPVEPAASGAPAAAANAPTAAAGTPEAANAPGADTP